MSTLTDKPEQLDGISPQPEIISLMKSAAEHSGDITAVSSSLMGNKYLHSYWPVKDSSGKFFAGVLISNCHKNARDAVLKMIVMGCILSSLLFFAVIAMYSYLMKNQLFTPLNTVVTAFGEMGRGELNKTIDENDFNTVELYNLALAYNKLNKNISEIIQSIKVFADSLINSAAEFSSMSRDLAESTQEQPAAVEESSAALVELSGSVE
jgi:methyl-accepting chemotaxis protein